MCQNGFLKNLPSALSDDLKSYNFKPAYHVDEFEFVG